MDYHRGKRPDVDWAKVKEVTVKSSMPSSANIYPYTEPEVRKPDEEEFNKDLNKLLMKYGFDRMYDAIRDEHYLREKNYKYSASYGKRRLADENLCK